MDSHGGRPIFFLPHSPGGDYSVYTLSIHCLFNCLFKIITLSLHCINSISILSFLCMFKPFAHTLYIQCLFNPPPYIMNAYALPILYVFEDFIFSLHFRIAIFQKSLQWHLSPEASTASTQRRRNDTGKVYGW